MKKKLQKNLIPHLHRKKGKNQISWITYSKKTTKNTRRSIKEVHDQQGGNETRNAQQGGVENTTNTQQSDTKDQPLKHTTTKGWRSLRVHYNEPLKNNRGL